MIGWGMKKIWQLLIKFFRWWRERDYYYYSGFFTVLWIMGLMFLWMLVDVYLLGNADKWF